MSEDSFYRKEIRHGFTISEVMKRSWAADLKILNEMLDICRKINANMFACYGTLLGAVREHGYIPWDDDIDMGLVGDDYVKFIDTIEHDHSDRYQIFNPYTRTWYKMNFSHIINQKDVSFARENLKEWCGCPFMTGLDVYPYYYIPRNKDDEEYVLTVLEKIDNTIALCRKSENLDSDNNVPDIKKVLDESIAIKLVELQHLTGYSFSGDRPVDNQLEILYDQVCRIPDEPNSDYITRYDEYAKNREKKYPKDYFKYMVYVPFEDTEMPCPIGYNEILEKRFGSRFIVPRQEKGAHDYPYYRKQINDKEYYKEEIRRKIKIDILPEKSVKNISDSIFKKKIKRRLYHTSVYEMLIHGDESLSTIIDTLDELFVKDENAELWWMPDMFFKTDDYAMDMIAPSLIKDYESIIKKYADKGIKFLHITDEYETLTDCFDEYYGDAGFLEEKFKKAGKKVILQEHKTSSIDNRIVGEANGRDSYDYPPLWWKVIERQDGKRKKVIIYIIDPSVLYQKRDKILKKIKNVLDIFRENSKDIALVWRPYIMNESEIEVFGEEFVKKMNEIIEGYRNAGWGILDISDDPEYAISIADAVYGDSNYMVTRCMEKGVPIMIQNPDIVT